MRQLVKILIILTLLIGAAFAQTKAKSADSSKSANDSTSQVAPTDDDNDEQDAIEGFLRSIFGDEMNDSDSSDKFDYFQDSDADGVADQMQGKTTVSKDTNSTSDKKTTSSATSTKKSAKKSSTRTKTTKRGVN